MLVRVDWAGYNSNLTERRKMEESTLVLEKEKEVAAPGSAARLIREVRRYTRRKFSSEDKIRIVLEGFRKEIPVSDLCRKESISSAIYYTWLKDFMEAGKARLKRDSLRDATSNEVRHLREENNRLKELGLHETKDSG
ncbi:MAG: transposase [Candidatus Omnitrophota bacterium]